MIDLSNSKAIARQTSFSFFDDHAEWKQYSKEFPNRVAKAKSSPEERFNGKTTAEAFAEAVEYAERSLIPRPLQYFFARKLIGLLQEEKKSMVLDYGAGAGNMGMIFAMAGFHTNFVEVEGALTHFIRWRLERHFIRSWVFGHNDDLDENVYDLVCMQNVLEHLDHPMEVLQKLTKAMKKGAYFLITFNSSGEGLDVVSMSTYEKELRPYLLRNFTIVSNTDGMLFKKK